MYGKNNQVPKLKPDRQISVSGDTMSNPGLCNCIDWYLCHCITHNWDLSADPREGPGGSSREYVLR